MPAPNLTLVYVRDAAASTDFYRTLLEIEPIFTSPRYVAFDMAPGVLFALWSGRSDALDDAGTRTSEIGIMLTGGAAAIDATFTDWTRKGVEVVDEPHDEVFGRTFVVADPDGNLIRVCPVD